jgi:dinuclear metal center YbgI/SA1388 family protein
MTTLHTIITHLENLAPLHYQESYDNCGLITGNKTWQCTGALTTLDCTEAVLDEAIALGCNLVVAHHPIVFKGLKKINGNTYIERVLIKAIQHNIAIYAIHTNLDHVIGGVNTVIATKLGLLNQRILAPKTEVCTLKKLITYIPVKHTDQVLQALFNNGLGRIGHYDECNFMINGTGTFRPLEGSNPVVGTQGLREKVNETRIEGVFEAQYEQQIVSALKHHHPYEEVAYQVIPTTNTNTTVGAGMIGTLPTPITETQLMQLLQTQFNVKVVRHSALTHKPISTIAVCGGAGSFLLPNAIAQQADAFVTADYKYHDFFDAENRLLIADIGHYESEQYTKELLFDELSKKFTTFAIHLSKIDTNSVNYFI